MRLTASGSSGHKKVGFVVSKSAAVMKTLLPPADEDE